MTLSHIYWVFSHSKWSQAHRIQPWFRQYFLSGSWFSDKHWCLKFERFSTWHCQRPAFLGRGATQDRPNIVPICVPMPHPNVDMSPVSATRSAKPSCTVSGLSTQQYDTAEHIVHEAFNMAPYRSMFAHVCPAPLAGWVQACSNSPMTDNPWRIHGAGILMLTWLGFLLISMEHHI